jgi:predicted amidophosphoribosyltransferase/DNA-binding transcriptional ArsR family regulator
MNPHQSFKKEIFWLILQNHGITAKKIQDKLGISQPTLFKHLKSLIDEEKIVKIGRPPKVIYKLHDKQIRKDRHLKVSLGNFDEVVQDYRILPAVAEVIEDKYLYISPVGILYYGLTGFINWCNVKSLEISKTANEYLQAHSKYQKYNQNGIIDASFKLQDSFQNEVHLDKLFYVDFYAYERFGKTKLAQLTFQAKQSQDTGLMKQIYSLVKDPINHVLEKYEIDAVAFIPPTVDRKVQFQSELKEILNLPLPHLKLIKLYNDTPVQQKTLKSKEDRILNASSTIFVDDDRVFENILLIDDFVGSGSTINQTAKKLRDKNLITGKLYGIALTGSFKGFEVINQV